MAGKTSNEASSSNSSTGGVTDRGQSVLADCGRRKSSCGYCRSGTRSSISHGLWAHSITVDDYQDLLDRGWRRSGCFLYKPEMERTCCPAYTIRLRAGDFVPSKEQLRVSKRIQRFLEGALDMKNSVDLVEDPSSKTDACNYTGHEVNNSPGNKEKEAELMNYLLEQIDNVMCKINESGEFPTDVQLPKATIRRVSQAKKKLLVEGAGDLLYSSSVAFQIAASLRRAQSAKKDVPQLGLSGQSAEENEPSPKMIAEKLANSLAQFTGTPGLLIKACNGHINFYAPSKQASTDEVAQIVTKDSTRGCGGSKRSSLKNWSENPQSKKHRLEIHLKRASFDPEEFSLYRRYQIKVHNDAPDRVTESSYRMFLVDTPLLFVPPTGDGTVPNCGFGSFHQQYVLDGRLVAVGVIDILPKCLSSKYLFWDPDFAFLSLGKYSALQEIDWIKENQAHCPSLQYYYLGYYIHSCNKMRYKAAYRPSELLCPLRYQWVPFDICRPLLNRKPYVVLSDFPVLQNGDSEVDMEPNHDDIGQEESNDMHMNDDVEMNPESESSDDESSPESSDMIKDGDVSKMLIGVQGTRLRYKDLQRTLGARERSYWETQLHKYARVVGPELSEKMVYLLG